MSRTISRLLLVEDDEMVRRSTESLLRRAGHEVQSFSTGEQLLETGVSDQTDCILLDLRLPGRSGIDVLRDLQQGGASVPVVMLSAHGDIPQAVEAMKLGAVDFLEKPFRVEKLLETVMRAQHAKSAPLPSEAQREARSRLRRLTWRQRQVLNGMASGLSNKEIAFDMGISVRTVEAYRAQLMGRLGVKRGAEAIRLATLGGLSERLVGGAATHT
jgi:two-component system response regulator FixJ